MNKSQIKKNIEVLKQEIKYAMLDEDEKSLELLYADLDDLEEKLASANDY